MDYVEVRGLEFHMAWELDRLLVQYSAEVRLSKSRLERLASATDLVFPQFRGQLVEIHQILRQWRKACPAKHTVPLPLRLAYGVAWLLAGKGFPRVGAALLMQYCFGLRPGELLQLVREDLIPAAMAGSNRAMLTLGAKRGTKVGRRQCALAVGPGAELGQLLVSAFYNGTKPGLSLTSITTVAGYGRILQIGTRLAGLDKVGISPHSPRAGWASEARLAGVPFTEVQEAGRWQSPHSLRIYLDVITTSELLRMPSKVDMISRWLQEDFPARYPWW
jgi:hypothetical protein